MAEGYQKVARWREKAKERLRIAFGGKCGICGYSRCTRNLGYHHLDPKVKEYAINCGRTVSWASLVIEARKCVLLCANCHGEVHAGLLEIPDDIQRFDEAFAEYRKPRAPRKACEECGSAIITHGAIRFCSLRCTGIARSAGRVAFKPFLGNVVGP